MDPKYFLTKYAWIQNKIGQKKVKWQPWDYQLHLLSELGHRRRIVILKARQLGISWLVAGYALWKVLFADEGLVLLISQTEDDAKKLFDKCKYIYNSLPEFLQRPLNHKDSPSVLDFKNSNARIEAMPTTDRAGKGTDATLVIRDELAEHRFGAENYRAIMPAIDAGGQSIDLSTIKKTDLENHFTERVLGVYEEGNASCPIPEHGDSYELYAKGSGASLFFMGWRLRPVRLEGMTLDEFWDYEIVPNHDALDREENYPDNIKEAVSSPRASCRFDTDMVKRMADMARGNEPLRTEFNGLVRIYKEPQAHLGYVFSIDTSEGGGDDPSSGIIVEWRDCIKVADFRGKISIDEQVAIIKYLYDLYHSPYIGPERNAMGILLIDRLLQPALGITSMHHTTKDKPGWWTSSVNRPVIIAELAEAIRDGGQISEPSLDVISQFYSFIRTKNKPEGEARKGTHDDFVICWAIALQLRKHIPIKAAPLKMYEIKRDY